MGSLRRGLLMVLPFVLWGTAMTAMAPLVSTGGPILVSCLRLLPAGIVTLTLEKQESTLQSVKLLANRQKSNWLVARTVLKTVRRDAIDLSIG